jgi:hypothetical protein
VGVYALAVLAVNIDVMMVVLMLMLVLEQVDVLLHGVGVQ